MADIKQHNTHIGICGRLSTSVQGHTCLRIAKVMAEKPMVQSYLGSNLIEACRLQWALILYNLKLRACLNWSGLWYIYIYSNCAWFSLYYLNLKNQDYKLIMAIWTLLAIATHNHWSKEPQLKNWLTELLLASSLSFFPFFFGQHRLFCFLLALVVFLHLVYLNHFPEVANNNTIPIYI